MYVTVHAKTDQLSRKFILSLDGTDGRIAVRVQKLPVFVNSKQCDPRTKSSISQPWYGLSAPNFLRSFIRQRICEIQRNVKFPDNWACTATYYVIYNREAQSTQERQDRLRQLSDNQQRRLAAETAQERQERLQR